MTILGRLIACLCALTGVGTIAMLVSVLVDRYQRVYTRKRYIESEKIEFNDLFEDRSNESPLISHEFAQSCDIDHTHSSASGNPHLYNLYLSQNCNALERDSRTHIVVSYDRLMNNCMEKNDLLNKIIAITSENQFRQYGLKVTILSCTSGIHTMSSDTFDLTQGQRNNYNQFHVLGFTSERTETGTDQEMI